MEHKQKHVVSLLIVIIVVWSFSYPRFVFGDSTAVVPTVADCVTKTGFTKDKCTEMIKKLPAASSDGKPGAQPQQTNTDAQATTVQSQENTQTDDSSQVAQDRGSIDQSVSANIIASEIDRANDIKSKEKAQITAINIRVGKIIAFLKSKNINTDSLESSLATFKSKADVLASALDSYVQTLNNAKTNADTTALSSVGNSKNKVKLAMDDLSSFYTSVLRASLVNAIEKNL